MGELTSMKIWLIANPDKQKNYADMPSYVLSWLSRHNAEAITREAAKKENAQKASSDNKDSGGYDYDSIEQILRGG